MFEAEIVASGVVVSVTGKIFGNEVREIRIYEYRGDVSPEVRGEVAQILAVELDASRVVFK